MGKYLCGRFVSPLSLPPQKKEVKTFAQFYLEKLSTSVLFLISHVLFSIKGRRYGQCFACCNTEDKDMLWTLLVLLIAVPFSSAGGTEHWSIGNIIITDPTVGFRLDIYSPTTPGSYPILIFITGFAGLIPASSYGNMLTTIAEENVIVIGISKIQNIRPDRMATHLGHFLDWVILPGDGAARLFAEHPAVQGVIPNTSLLGLLSHSAAGHSITQYLNGTCGVVKLIVMMDPVDGIDPWGQIKNYITRMRENESVLKVLLCLFLDPPTPLPFRTPALIISTGLGKFVPIPSFSFNREYFTVDGLPSSKLTPACAPNNISNDRWYRSLYGPTFFVNFTDFGHADNLDGLPAQVSQFMCSTCKGTVCNFPQFKADEAKLITTFVHGIFTQNPDQIRLIENPNWFLEMTLSHKYDLHNYNYTTGGPGGFCTHD